jgi:hypothetical protein
MYKVLLNGDRGKVYCKVIPNYLTTVKVDTLQRCKRDLNSLHTTFLIQCV